MKIHHIIYFILFGCLISCSSGSQKSTKDIPFNHFSEVYSIKHKKLNITPEKLPSQKKKDSSLRIILKGDLLSIRFITMQTALCLSPG